MNKMIPVLMALASIMLAHNAPASEITVLSGNPVEPGLNAAAAAFQKETGHAVKITYNTTPQMRKRVGGGDTFDVVIAPPAATEEFANAGKVKGDRVNVGRVGIGVMIRPGAPVPDISNADALKKSVLEAESIVFARSASGLYIESLLKKMGIYEQVEGKSARYLDAAPLVEHVLKGKGKEFGFAATTVILLYREQGLRLVGPLPPEVQIYTSYVAVPMSAGSNKEVAGAFVRFLGGPGKPMFVAAGID